ncbi:hypothetical protein N7492_010604 [Penicillium capsulatum]|uniref:Phospholipase/carboxylesterase/thioesterase domain-containing protein n=1 Tax=Penicillium capsulatum TaxID=69766 RepID=A0A9W9HRR0_9EURO|nr:hypothetical protein N7492_010604 [Penicillium capsulatum]KAJ6113103.1 hypothetical protein N7512_008427 [Penicillium capsulatum]
MEFPTPHIHHPQTEHTHTIVLLHGRGSNGLEFAEELFSSSTSNGQNLASRLPNYRWIFPTSRDRWSTTFQEEMCAWFDIHSLCDIQAKQDLQKEGLRESILQILELLESETRLLHGQASRLYLGGMSQGMATALWVFLAGIATGRIEAPLGGLVGFSGWLPFAHSLESILDSDRESSGPCTLHTQGLVAQFFFSEISNSEISPPAKPSDVSVLSTPTFLSHDTDDAWVLVELGRHASRILQKIMGHVEWNESTGAENEGHWLKEPEGFDQILRFLETSAALHLKRNM